jgi:hypothetical protein
MRPILLGVSLIVFIAGRLAPGDPVQILFGDISNPTVEARARAQLGLDKPLPIQYVRFVERLARFDFGTSYAYPGLRVSKVVTQALPVSLGLGLLAMTVAVLIGVRRRYGGGPAFAVLGRPDDPVRHAARNRRALLRGRGRTGAGVFGAPALRDGLRFQSGQPVTAADVKYTLDRLADPKLNSPNADLLLTPILGYADEQAGKAQGLSGVKVAGSNTVDIGDRDDLPFAVDIDQRTVDVLQQRGTGRVIRHRGVERRRVGLHR